MRIVLAIALLTAALSPTLAQQPKTKPKPAPAPEPVIELKGFKLGMPEAEAAELYRVMPEVTIAGAAPKYQHNPIGLKYEDGVLTQFIFFFRPANFEQVRDAITSKYPMLKCEASTVTNRMGGKFTQEECTMTSAGTVLSLRKFVSDIETSSLTMMSSQKLNEAAEARRKAAAKDL